MLPSRLIARGRKGIALERSVLSTILSQRRSGIGSGAVEASEDDLVWDAEGAKAAAEPAIRTVAMMDFILAHEKEEF